MSWTSQIALAGRLMAASGMAQAQPYDPPRAAEHHHHYYRHQTHYRTCGADRRMRSNNGTVIGAVGGGVLGSALGGGKLGNVLLGAGAGAVAGHELGKRTTRC